MFKLSGRIVTDIQLAVHNKKICIFNCKFRALGSYITYNLIVIFISYINGNNMICMITSFMGIVFCNSLI